MADWHRHRHVEHVWGTVVSLEVRGPGLGPQKPPALADAVAFLHQVDALFSTYRPDSPITLLRNGVLDEAAVPPIVHEVLDLCRHARTVSHGVFDPWAVPGGVDPSGLVKGWAAGVVANRLVAAGLPNVVVNAAGDIACRGHQADDEPWAIGILDPRDQQRVVRTVRITDGAVATSGRYERGDHIVDPRSGRRETYYDSATIVGPDAALADALATAALVGGPASAAFFVGLPDWSAYLITGDQASYFGPAFAD